MYEILKISTHHNHPRPPGYASSPKEKSFFSITKFWNEYVDRWRGWLYQSEIVTLVYSQFIILGPVQTPPIIPLYTKTSTSQPVRHDLPLLKAPRRRVSILQSSLAMSHMN